MPTNQSGSQQWAKIIDDTDSEAIKAMSLGGTLGAVNPKLVLRAEGIMFAMAKFQMVHGDISHPNGRLCDL